jgi:endonuclease III
MPKGMITRQPAKSGRHDGAKKYVARTPSTVQSVKRASKKDVTPTFPSLPSAPKAKKVQRPAKAYNPVAPERVSEILKRLDAHYGNVTCALTHTNAWELLVATILSAQCTDVRVNMVTPTLFKKYPTPQHFAALKSEELEPDIKSTGFFRNKSKSIVGAAKEVVNTFGGKVPQTMAELLTIPGAARKTANVVLGSWFGIAEGVVVDTHVHRISRRLELTRNDDPPKIEQDLMKVIPRDHWILFSHQVIHHGRSLCLARGPKCAECPLENICHAEDKTWSTVEQHKGAK